MRIPGAPRERDRERALRFAAPEPALSEEPARAPSRMGAARSGQAPQARKRMRKRVSPHSSSSRHRRRPRRGVPGLEAVGKEQVAGSEETPEDLPALELVGDGLEWEGEECRSIAVPGPGHRSGAGDRGSDDGELACARRYDRIGREDRGRSGREGDWTTVPSSCSRPQAGSRWLRSASMSGRSSGSSSSRQTSRGGRRGGSPPAAKAPGGQHSAAMAAAAIRLVNTRGTGTSAKPAGSASIMAACRPHHKRWRPPSDAEHGSEIQSPA